MKKVVYRISCSLLVVGEDADNGKKTGVPLQTLPETLTDSIVTLWGADCSAAGALARNILYRNGIRMEADCEETLPRASQKGQNVIVQSLKTYPNPVNDELMIELPKNIICTSIELIGLSDGRPLIQSPPYSGEILKFNTSKIPNGVYAVLARLANGSILQAKVLIMH